MTIGKHRINFESLFELIRIKDGKNLELIISIVFWTFWTRFLDFW